MSQAREVSAERAAQMASAGAQIVDVREGYEREAGHVADSSHIELAELTSRAHEIDRSRAVIFQCRIGGRSAMAASAFAAAGYDAYTLSGGLLAWVDAGLPLVPHDGTVAAH